MPKILVCGGRDFDNYNLLSRELNVICVSRGWMREEDELGNSLPNVIIIEGGARGADALASEWAIVNWCPCKIYKADWGKYGKSAGPIRNQQMLDEEKPDLVVAFPGGRGTADMVSRAKKQGYEVYEVSE